MDIPQVRALSSGAANNSVCEENVAEELSSKARFELAREIVKHEDGLVNSRITWLQVFQGLLFTAFFAGLGLLKENSFWKYYPRGREHLIIALVILGILGMLSSVAAYLSVRSATLQLTEVELWWVRTGSPENYPPLTGGHGLRIPFTQRKVLGADILLVFLIVWVAFLVLFLCS